MKQLLFTVCLLGILSSAMAQGDAIPTTRGQINAGERAFTISTGLMLPRTSKDYNPKPAAGINFLVGGIYFVNDDLGIYTNVGYSRINKEGYKQRSVPIYSGIRYYPVAGVPLSIGGELGLNFLTESELEVYYDFWTDEYHETWYDDVAISWYTAGVLGYELVLPFARLTAEGRLGFTYRGFFAAANVGIALPLFD